MRFSTTLISPLARVGWCLAIVLLLVDTSANALVVEDQTGTTSAPTDDPGWNYVSSTGRNMVYLGDGWVMTAFHVGTPTASEVLTFNGQGFNVISNQAYIVKNPTGLGLTADTDLRLFRINGDPGLAPLKIASEQLFESSTPEAQRQVTIIGSGPSRNPTTTSWNITAQNGTNNDIWTEVGSGGAYNGYRANAAGAKRWGTNRIADEDAIFGGSDNDFRGTLNLTLGVGVRDVVSMVTRFDSPASGGLANEAQAVSGDSGSSVFYKRNGVWELIGIVNAVYSTLENQSSLFAVYDATYTTFADMTAYRSNILDIMNSHANYSVMGDINLDGVVSGATTGGIATGDIAAFVAGWGYDNGTGVGTVTSWKKGDLNRDGKTDAADFLLLRQAINPAGSGSFTLQGLLGGMTVVPEPASLGLLLVGAGFLLAAARRRA